MRRTALLLVTVLAAAGCGGEDEPSRPASTPAPAATTDEHPGLKVWAAMGCGSCHTFEPAGSTTTIGPPLDLTLKTRDRAYIMQKIVSPTAGSIMPEDFGKRMSDRELKDLVDFLYENTH